MINDIKKEVETEAEEARDKELMRLSVDEHDFEKRHLQRAAADKERARAEKTENRLFL